MRNGLGLLMGVLLCSYPLSMSASYAQGGVVGEHSSSSSSVSETDVKGYAFKYKERFRNYTEQIATGESKGWLTAAEATTFRSRLDELRAQEAAAGKKGYPADAIADLDKAQTKFNEDLSSTSQKPKTSATATQSKTQVEKKVTTH